MADTYLKIFDFRESVLKLLLSVFLCLIGLNGFGQKTSSDELQNLLNLAEQHHREKAFKKSYHFATELLYYSYAAQDTLYAGKAYFILGKNDEELQDYNAAKKKYEKALQQIQPLNDSVVLTKIYNGLGNIEAYQSKEASKANRYYLKALAYNASNAKTRVGIVANLCWNYLENLDTPKINPYLSELKTFSKKGNAATDDRQHLALVNTILGRYYAEATNYDLANFYFKNAIQIGKEFKLWKELKTVFLHRSKFYHARQKNNLAYEDLQQHLFYKDQYLSENTYKRLKTQQLKFQQQEHQREIKASREETQILSEAFKIKNKFLLGYTILSVLLLILICIILKSNRTKKRLINKLNQNNEELAKAKEDAFHAAETKSHFISSISHEIRTPLHGVIGISSLLLAEKEISESNKKLIKSLKFSGDYLLNLINNVLMMSKIDNNKVKIRARRFDLKSMRENIMGAVSFSADKLNCQVNVHIDENLPRFILVDGAILFEVLINLIENAIKFSENGEVNVYFDNLEKMEDELKVQFRIIDDGPGIPEKEQELIFNKFSQLSTDASIMEGTGIGLSIVKDLLMLMGSDIELKSEEGEGSMFYFSLTVKPVPDETLEIEGIELKKTYRGKKILLIEDNKINKMIVKKFLKPYDVDLSIYENGDEGLEAALSGTYDLLLLDINIPGKDGYEISQRLRKEKIMTPIIAVTAAEKTAVAKRVRASGMNDILIKPFNLSDLLKKLNKYLH